VCKVLLEGQFDFETCNYANVHGALKLEFTSVSIHFNEQITFLLVKMLETIFWNLACETGVCVCNSTRARVCLLICAWSVLCGVPGSGGVCYMSVWCVHVCVSNSLLREKFAP
jgi:hypothetical protein